MEGVVAVWVASCALRSCHMVSFSWLGSAWSAAVLVPYVVLLGTRRDRLGRMGLPTCMGELAGETIREEEIEHEAAIHPQRGRVRDWLTRRSPCRCGGR